MPISPLAPNALPLDAIDRALPTGWRHDAASDAAGHPADAGGIGDLVSEPLPSLPQGVDIDQPTQSLESTIGVLHSNYERIASESPLGDRDTISTTDLLIASKDTSLPKDLREAAAFLLQGQAARNALDTAAGRNAIDGIVSRADLDAASTALLGGNSVRLLDTSAGRGGVDGHVSDADLSAALRDPTLPPALRGSTAFSLMSDERIVSVIGTPNIDPSLSPADRAQVIHAFASLIRASPLGAIEAQRLASYGTRITLRDEGASTTAPDGSTITLSRGMIQGADGGAGVLAHEGGHVIYHRSGLDGKVRMLEQNGTIPPHSSNLINEAFAGAFGNRIHLAWSAELIDAKGLPGKDLDAYAHTSLLSDVLSNLKPGSFYARYYNVDVGKTLEHIDAIKAVLDNDLAPYLRQNFPITDGQLTA